MTGPDARGAATARASIPALEWIAAATGLLLTLGMMGVIGWEALQGGRTQPPSVEATVERVTPGAAGFVVEVALRNRSSSTAAAVQLQGDLTSGGETLETSSAMLDYVPGKSSRRAGLFFTEDPRRHELKVRALGYAEP